MRAKDSFSNVVVKFTIWKAFSKVKEEYKEKNQASLVERGSGLYNGALNSLLGKVWGACRTSKWASLWGLLYVGLKLRRMIFHKDLVLPSCIISIQDGIPTSFLEQCLVQSRHLKTIFWKNEVEKRGHILIMCLIRDSVYAELQKMCRIKESFTSLYVHIKLINTYRIHMVQYL